MDGRYGRETWDGRVFDVVINSLGEIQRYETQNIKGCVFVDETEVRRQIQDFLDELKKAS